MSTSKFLDFIGMTRGNSVQQGDAQQAYMQTLLLGDETWIFLPPHMWPKAWQGKFKNPVVRLRLALYAQPLSGAYWEKHCHKQLLDVGFSPIPGWECLYVHKRLQIVLSVYVDDFKMAGKQENLAAGWKLTKTKIRLDKPT